MSNNWAFIVGINHYDHHPDQNLRFAVRDAELLRDFLCNHAQFPSEQVICCLSDADNRYTPTYPTCSTLLKWINRELHPDKIGQVDRIWFYFSGHGVSENGRDYLLAADTLQEDLQRFALPLDEVVAALRRHKQADVVLILDACRELKGQKKFNVLGEETVKLTRDNGITTIFSCDYGQVSYELEVLQHGAFTYALVEALKQHTLPTQLERYLQQRVAELNRAARQTPKIRLESASKAFHPLLPDRATSADITEIERQAIQAERDWNFEEAKDLWLQIMEIDPSQTQRSQAKKAIKQMEDNIKRYQAFPQPSSSLPDIDAEGETSSLSLDAQSPKSSFEDEPVDDSSVRDPDAIQPEADSESVPVNLSRRRLIQLTGTGLVIGAGGLLLGRTPSEGKTPTFDQDNSLPEAPPDNKPEDITDEAADKIKKSFEELTPKKSETLQGKPVEFDVVTVNAKGEVTETKRQRSEYYREDLGEGIFLDLMAIPSGTFVMGAPEGEAGSLDSERPQHQVNVSSFWMGKFLMTQAQWKQVALLPQVERELNSEPAAFKGANRPVEQVSWFEAVEFCARLSNATGREYRLPTEAEWEYACRAGTTTPFHFGETITTDLANYRGTDWTYKGNVYPGNYEQGPKGLFREQTTDVGSFPPNAFGLYDMHGNVWEWCLDHWHDGYADKPAELKVNGNLPWRSPDSDADRSLRGGSWYAYPWGCRSALRSYGSPAVRYNGLGFRVVCRSA